MSHPPVPQVPILETINQEEDQIADVVVDCNRLWSYAQQFPYLRLSDSTRDDKRFIRLYAARARRIAATYARFYLEIEEGGDPSKLGRYYWMALGAFAVKTVACLLDSWQVQASYATGISERVWDTKQIANGLAKGNLWLFCDIAPTHWFYNHYPEQFFNNMICANERHAQQCVEPVKGILNSLPWAGESLPTIDHFALSDDIKAGFELVEDIESGLRGTVKRKAQYDHLMHIADHEQMAVLQKLIYDDENFSRWTARQRNWALLNLISPAYEIVFSDQCSGDDEALINRAPDDMVVENFDSRMEWITDVAKEFHQHMNDKREYMHDTIRQIATWVNSPDARFVY